MKTRATEEFPINKFVRAALGASVCGLLTCCLSCARPAPPVPPPAPTPNAAPTETPEDSATPPEANESTASSPAEATQPENTVLRHAVFFKFKDESTDEQVQEVADAFAALPGKIPEIIDFQWGVNNSPEGIDDGFTHCFLLTFADDAGRAAYLPHAEHKAFGDVLRPHMDKVFVIDYWGTPTERLDKELKHAVFFKFKDDAAAAALPSKISAIKSFEWGRNNSPEKHDHGFTHCFMVTFDSEEGRAVYLPHDDHSAFVELLKPHLDKARVLDFFSAKSAP
jgi:hypothetical protein